MKYAISRKPSFQFLNAQIPRAGQLLGPFGIFEVLVVQTQHVFARDPVAFASHVDVADAGLAGVRVANLVEEQRDHYSVLNADHRAAAAAEQEADRGVAQLAAISHVERDRVAAAQLVADVLVAGRDANAALFEPAFEFDFDLAREVDLSEADVSMVIFLHVHQVLHVARVQLLDQAFGQHRDAVMTPKRATFDDSAFDDVTDLRE